MEISALNNSIQTQVKHVEVKQQMTQGVQEQISQQNILDKVKNVSGYIPTVQEKAMIKAIELANKKFNGDNKEFEFAIHEKTKQIMVKIIDTDTKQLIREIPPEKILDMVANMCEAAGIFVDEKR